MSHFRYLLYSLLILLLATACSSEPEDILPNTSVFEFTVDPVSQTVTLNETSIASLGTQQASDEPRVLSSEELQVETFDFAFLPGNVLSIEASFSNTSSFNFEQPFSFSSASGTSNIVSSTEPSVSDADLGGDGVLSPNETTALLSFEVEHNNEPFSYFVNASAIVVNPNPSTGFLVNTTEDLTDANPGDGICESEAGNGLCSLRAAVEETNALPGPDTVDLPAATYEIFPESTDVNTTSEVLAITDDLIIEGEDRETTIIRLSDFVYSGSIVINASETATLMLRNLTILGYGGPSIASGFRNLGTSTLEDVTIAGLGSDGLLRIFPISIVNDGDLTLLRTRSGRTGNFGNLTIFDSTIGGVGNRGTLLIEGSTLRGAGVFGDGGPALYNGQLDGGDGVAVIRNSDISRTSTEYGAGGIINDTGASVTLEDSRVIGNYSSARAGTVIASGIDNRGDMVLRRSIVSGNGSFSGSSGISSLGGGIYNQETGNLTLENSTVSQNGTGGGEFGSTGIGGGLYNLGNVSIVNSTFANNRTTSPGNFENSPGDPSPGGAIYNEGTVEFINSIIANSRALTECEGPGTFTSLGNNIGSDDTCNFSQVTDLSSTDPLLGPLQDNGGLTETHALLSGSPAIDSGTDTGLATDQRGVARPQGTAFDIGSFEKE